MATTENTKILNKDYLAEQLYNYHTKYITEGVEKKKQDKIDIVSNHLTWEENRIGINIDDSVAKQNDYIVLKNADDGSLSWKTPITDQGDLANSDSLVTGKVVFNFEGSTNINTLGTITAGTWNAGDITLNDHNLTIGGNGKITVGNFVIEQNSYGNLQIKYANNSYLTLDATGGLTTKSIDAETIDAETINATDNASIFDLNICNTITINQFVIEQNDYGNLQIKYADNSYLTLDTTGNLNTAKVTADTISTKSFSLKGKECEFATIGDFNIDLIEQNES